MSEYSLLEYIGKEGAQTPEGADSSRNNLEVAGSQWGVEQLGFVRGSGFVGQWLGEMDPLRHNLMMHDQIRRVYHGEEGR